MTVIGTANFSGLDPEAYLADILDRIPGHNPKRLDELLSWAWKADRDAAWKAARQELSGLAFSDPSGFRMQNNRRLILRIHFRVD